MIGAPANIGTQGDHDTVMRSPWPASGVPFQGQLVSLHDTEHPFGIDLRLSVGLLLPIEQGGDPPIAIGRPLVGPDGGSAQ